MKCPFSKSRVIAPISALPFAEPRSKITLAMRILIAPDKFKDCLSAIAVANAIADGLRRVDPNVQIDLCPLADGGEGTAEVLVNSLGGEWRETRVTGPLPEMKVTARFGLIENGKTAVMEMASAAGLALLKPQQRNPMYTTTFGVGELLMAAAHAGASQVILGIGGSATIDGGIGCAQACDLPVILQDGEPLSRTEPLTGCDISRVVLIKHGRGSAIEKIKIAVACDVDNPLYGPRGAAHTFGPQKGASAREIEQLDTDLRELARRCVKTAEAELPGAGAAGGLGFGMVAFFGATLRPGVQIVLEAVKFTERLRGVDLCITGEGKLDAQTLGGKTVAGVAIAARRAGVPCIALAGLVQKNLQPSDLSLKAAIAVSDPNAPLADSLATALHRLADSAAQLMRDLPRLRKK